MTTKLHQAKLRLNGKIAPMRSKICFDCRLDVQSILRFLKNTHAVLQVTWVTKVIKKPGEWRFQSASRAIEYVPAMFEMFVKCDKQSIRVSWVVTFHYGGLINPSFPMPVLEEIVVFAMNEIVMHNRVEARRGNPSIREDVEMAIFLTS